LAKPKGENTALNAVWNVAGFHVSPSIVVPCLAHCINKKTPDECSTGAFVGLLKL
jgi:hypothetical protein